MKDYSVVMIVIIHAFTTSAFMLAFNFLLPNFNPIFFWIVILLFYLVIVFLTIISIDKIILKRNTKKTD